MRNQRINSRKCWHPVFDQEVFCRLKKCRDKIMLGILFVMLGGLILTGCGSSGKTEKVSFSKTKDGEYEVSVKLSGGSKRADILSPAKLMIRDGGMSAQIEWSSPNYDYMIIDEEKYFPLEKEGNSTFEIPVRSLDQEIPVIADTVAMSEPHEIEYTLYFDSKTIRRPDGNGLSVEESKENGSQTLSHEKGFQEVELPLKKISSMELSYATQFAIDRYEEGYTLVRIRDGRSYLVVPEGKAVKGNLPKDLVILQQPIERVYLVATSAMDLFGKLNCMDRIQFSGTSAENWYIEEAKEAMDQGKIVYAGKYSAPDYEKIVSGQCKMAVESTMIYHNPEVKEKLESFGIPVFIERSSYEPHPLGKMEWIRLYGVLLGKEEEAEKIYSEKVTELLEKLSGKEENGERKTVAFFYVNSNGSVNVRKSSDYISEMIRMAGGTYIFSDLGNENSLSTMNMQMESFYAQAKDADYLIYNSTIEGELRSAADLIQKNSLFQEFKAVKEGNIWCVSKRLFQESMGLSDMILDIKRMLEGSGNGENMKYLYKVDQ